ncbi:hypothetical protein [Marinobacterium rhizophilum]|uniref:Uncharacterized protein n=1 Tax=Marinobacterium rhizophilum TaxID=420402 RepID=A0ABY5HR50_9GAMM|nr:hypothetical protein [Marinobacterium rhizophilum]UTW13371.1 hypothetical protein KDW95_06885 [Marinobacterium rhizophilum]
MERKVIDQSALVYDVLSFREDFKVSSPSGAELDPYGEHDVRGYQWLLSDQLTCSEVMVATCLGQTWVGVKAA